jgi:hypothetical protein
MRLVLTDKKCPASSQSLLKAECAHCENQLSAE